MLGTPLFQDMKMRERVPCSFWHSLLKSLHRAVWNPSKLQTPLVSSGHVYRGNSGKFQALVPLSYNVLEARFIGSSQSKAKDSTSGGGSEPAEALSCEATAEEDRKRHSSWLTAKSHSEGSSKKNEWTNWKSNGQIACTKLHGFNKLWLQQTYSR